MKEENIITLVAMACITGLESAALIAGIDGQAFALCVALVAGLAGFEIKSVIDARKIKKLTKE